MHLYLTPISLVYIISGVTGFVLSILAMPRYVFSYRMGRKLTDELDRGKARLVNAGVVVTEAVRLSVHVLGAAVGIQSLFLSPMPTVYIDGYHRIFGLEVVVILLWANIGTTINTAIVYIQYRLLRSRRPPRLHTPAARHALAQVKWQIRGLTQQIRELKRNRKVVENLDDRNGTVEEVVEVKRTVTKRIDDTGKDER
jgi:hypothetical protein